VPIRLLNVTYGPLTHPQDTEKLFPDAVHPEEFLTVMVWLPLAMPVNAVPVCQGLPSMLYSRSAPIGLVTVTTAFPDPREQSAVCTGLSGDAGCASITTLADAGEVHPVALVTLKLYVPAIKSDIVKLVPVPAIAPGLIIQLPDGKSFNTTLPVAVAQVGCVMVPTTGAGGADGSLSVAFTPVAVVHPLAVTSKLLYVPAGAVMVAVPPATTTLAKLPPV